MYNYFKMRQRSLYLLLSIILFQFSNLSAQNVEQMNVEFAEELSSAKGELDLRNQSDLFYKYFSKDFAGKGEITEDSLFIFKLSDVSEFLTESEFFKVEKKKVILPFLAQELTTIPHYVESGGLKFEVLMGAKVDGQPALDYMLTCASKIYKIKMKNVELRYIWISEDQKLLGGPNSVVVTSVGREVNVNTLAIKEAKSGVGLDSGFGGLVTYVKKGDWKRRFGVQD